MYRAKWLGPDDYKAVFSLLQRNDFPYVPETYKDAVKHIAQSEILGIYFGKCLCALLLGIPTPDGKVYVDACADRHVRGKVWNRRFLKKFFGVFDTAKEFIIETDTANKSAERLGFHICDKGYYVCKPSELRIKNG